MDQSYDTIIIGAGMSGLAAGIRLAMYDNRVCILERHTTIGGLNSFYRLDGRNYDVGLHAVTNYQAKPERSAPLGRVLRQLRFSMEELQLRPQLESLVAFGERRLRFSNDVELLISQIADEFPADVDSFRQLIAELPDYTQLEDLPGHASAREYVSERIKNPQLVEMLLAPLLFYGSAREHDLDLDQFVILFRSIYLEGFARPREGVRLLLRLLTRKYKSLGGQLRLRSGVQQLRTRGDRVEEVVLDSGEVLTAGNVLSSAGWAETRELIKLPTPEESTPEESRAMDDRPGGRLSFVETMSALNCPARELGLERTIVFYNCGETFQWRRPQELVDPQSGVICVPENFAFERPLEFPLVRVTCLANFDRWRELPPDAYVREKENWYERILDTVEEFTPRFRSHIVARDMFTPTTIRKFTGHAGGAVYGAPQKQRDGTTPLENLFVCGTDQGLIGIIGAMLSGVSMANRLLVA